MLDQTLESKTGLAWMRDSRSTRALRAERWSHEPTTGLNFYAPDFALTANQAWLVGEKTELTVQPRELPRLAHRVEPSAAAFANLMEEVLMRIDLGEFQKVVPVVCEELEFAEPLSQEMFSAALTRDFPHQFSYGFEFQGEGLCGVTPELLFSVSDGVLQTMALAGTGGADGPSLLDDRKERHEHNLVIEHIVSELVRWGVPDVGTTQERVYGSLKHLYTPIHMDLRREISFSQLVSGLHPTAALGGWPRKSAMQWMETQKFHADRGRFGAPFGFIDGDEMRCVVAIRGLQWRGAHATLSAGCGVVKESQSLREWKELELKRAAVCRMLGLAL